MYVDILVLAQLTVQPHHGYELKRQIERSLGNAFSINNNHLYPALKHFEEVGAIYCEIERHYGRPDRHIYHITEKGKETLHNMLKEFSSDIADSDNEFLTRIAFFHLLEKETRISILKCRESVLKKHLAHLNKIQKQIEMRNYPTYPYTKSVINFQSVRLEHEMQQVLDLIKAEE